MDEIKKLASCGHPWAEQRALIALDLADQYAKDDITREEYDELLLDLIRTDELSAESDNMEVKNMLVGAIMGLTKVA